jgi:O-antigen/teichoic acid export membrane protein
MDNDLDAGSRGVGAWSSTALDDCDESRASEASGADSESLGRAAAAGSLWLTGQKAVLRLSGLVTIALLTRLISPEDFGVVAAAATITPFILVLADLGLSTYLVQAERVDDRTLSTAFWFSIATGAALAGALAFLAPLLATAFNVPGSTSVLRAMSLSALLVVSASVPTALLRRRMQFRLLALQAAVAGLVAQVVAVALAFAKAGAWALVAQLLVSQLITGVLAWRSAAWWPTRQFDIRKLATMASFGTQVVAVDGVAALRASGEAAIISQALGPAALGYFSIGQRLVQVGQDIGGTVLVPVSTVVFAKVRESRERLRAGYLRATKIAYAVIGPIFTLIVVAAPLLMPLLFGNGWEQSVPVAQGLALAAVLVLGAMIDHGLHYGMGKPGRWLAYALVIDALTLGATFLAAPHGLSVVALSFVGVALVATIARWFLVGGLIDVRARDLGMSFLRSLLPLVASAVVGIGVLAACSDLPSIVALALVGIAIGGCHLVVLRLVSRQVLADTLEMLPIPARFSALRRLA